MANLVAITKNSQIISVTCVNILVEIEFYLTLLTNKLKAKHVNIRAGVAQSV
jgi:hypothetical protein